MNVFRILLLPTSALQIEMVILTLLTSHPERMTQHVHRNIEADLNLVLYIAPEKRK
jgi:hypothetical protein